MTVWGGVFFQSVGILLAAIDILCYFVSKRDVSDFVKITQDVNGRTNYQD